MYLINSTAKLITKCFLYYELKRLLFPKVQAEIIEPMVFRKPSFNDDANKSKFSLYCYFIKEQRNEFDQKISQLTFICSKSTIEIYKKV